jgi:hypothetical protein
MDKDIYMHVSSKDSSLYFPQNRPALFRVKLNTTLNLEGTWQIGLCSIFLKNVNVQSNASVVPSMLFIACNICTGLIVDGIQTRIFRSIDISGNVSRDYSLIYYVPIEVRFIDNIEFSITTDLFEEALFDGEDGAGSVSMIIHIKRN